MIQKSFPRIHSGIWVPIILDGRIPVHTQAGHGTTFTVIWPPMRDA